MNLFLDDMQYPRGGWIEDRQRDISVVNEREQVDIIINQLSSGSLNLVLAPELWAKCKLPVQLTWSPILFDDANQAGLLPDTGGIYSFILKPNLMGLPETSYLLYIGKTKEISRRYRDYQFYKSDSGYKKRPHINSMLNKWPAQIWFFFAKLDGQKVRNDVEDILLNCCVPPFNIEFKGRVNTAVRQWRNLGGFR